MNGGTWIAMIGAIISAAGALTVLWVRWRDRPEAEWHFTRFGFPKTTHTAAYLLEHRGGKRPDLTIECLNIGDGAAHAVSVTTEGCSAAMVLRDKGDKRGFRTPQVEPRVETGQGIGVLVWFTRPIEDRVSLDIHWTQPPTRHHRTDTQGLLLVAREGDAGFPALQRLQWWRRKPETFVLDPEDPVRNLLAQGANTADE